jgi:hypothetical protein
VAVGAPRGSGCVGPAFQADVSADGECATVQVDFRNTFNNFRHEAAQAEVKEQDPILLLSIQ